MASPELSVVIPSVNGLGDLVGCLEALERMRENVSLEVVVVDRLGEEVRDVVRRDFPETVLIETESSATIPEMRHAAFQKVTADAVAVIEDHVIVPPEWGRQLLDALAEGNDVVGGPIENAATETLMDWATFLCEYSACIPPLPAGESEWLPGNNVIYRRSLLQKHREVTAEGKWENRLHDAAKADGTKLIMKPEIVVGHKKHYTFGEYFSQRYIYARSYAGARVRDEGFAKRLVYGAAAFILPPLLFYRTIRRIMSKGGYGGKLAKSLPLIFLFVCSWGVGEIVGYWFGAGDSLSKVR